MEKLSPNEIGIGYEVQGTVKEGEMPVLFLEVALLPRLSTLMSSFSLLLRDEMTLTVIIYLCNNQ